MDLELSQLRSIFDGIVSCPSDSKCFLMDDAGFLINAPDGGGRDGSLIPQKFMAAYSAELSQLAAGLLDSNQMTKNYCLDFADLTRQAFYDVSDLAVVTGTASCGGIRFSVSVVPETSFRLVVIWSLGSVTECCSSQCSTNIAQDQCELPCSANFSLQNRCTSFRPTSTERVYPSCPADPPLLRSAEGINGSSSSSLSTGAIIGIAVGAAVGVALIILIIALIVRSNRAGGARHAAHEAAVQMEANPAMDYGAASAPPVPAEVANQPSAPPLSAL